MKKKLLITLGDSFTEGIGCYDYRKPESTYHIGDEYHQNRFHELGWPNRLGKKLNYDKVINLGWGGSSNSAHVKLFVEKILPHDFSEYDVLVIWMLTSPERFSFYSNGEISQFLPGLVVEGEEGTKLEQAYIHEIKDLYEDSILETVFYIRCLEQMCQNNSFDLLITSWCDGNFIENIKRRYPSKYFMKWVNNKPIAFLPYDEYEIYKSRVCGHPNEKGYEQFAINMMESILIHTPQFINKNKVEKFEWEWEGKPKRWNHLI